jgi:hypothetical protein
MIDLADEVRRLALQLERDVVARAHLRQLLTTTDSTITGDRVQLRALRARLKRPPSKR